jgi:cytochrome c-type biogenesis protein CcmH/NrfG
VTNSIIVFMVAALMTSAAAVWTLRAYRFAADTTPSAGPALAASAGVACIALVAYLAVGRPDLPGAPFDARIEALRHRDPATYTPEEALAVLNRAARDNPRDARPRVFAGQVLLSQGRVEEAERQFDAGLRRDPRSVEAMMGLGRAMVRVADGRVTPEALALFQQAGAASDDPAPLIYQALAALQSNRAADARGFWREAYRRMSADDPRREMARRMSAGEGAP